MASAVSTHGRVIVVVDDDPNVLDALRLALQDRYTVHTARCAREARVLLETVRPDLLILDVRLSHDDGLNLLAEFRRQSSIPVLLITGYGSEAVAARALSLRANAYLTKPVSLHALRSEVTRLLAEGPRPEHVAERARDLIDEIYAEPLSAEEIARRLGVKPRPLLDAFRARFGRTPMQYLREVRVRHAQGLLLSTALTVSEIAVRTGFRDATYFDRFFKDQVGVSPGEFRRTRLPPKPAP